MRKSAGIVAVSLLFVAACGEGDGEPASAPTAEETADDAADEPSGQSSDEPAGESSEEPAEEATDEATGEGPAVDEASGETGEEPAAEPADEPDGDDGDGADDGASLVVSGDPDSDWCVAARDVEALSEQLDSDVLNFADPAAVESAYTGFLEAIDAARAVAPPEIAADVETTYDGFRLLSDTLAAVEWDFLDADLSVIDDLDAEMNDAGDRIGDYNEQVCGIAQDDDDEPESADGGSDFDPSAGTPREQMAAGLVSVGFTPEEADCIVEQIDIAAYLESNDDQLILDAFDACEIPLSRLAELGG